LKRIISGIALAMLIICTLMFASCIKPAKVNGLVGDLNSDGVVNIEDLTIAASAFGSRPDQPRWNSQTDINKDNVTNIVDMCIIAKHLGETAPTVVSATVNICPQSLNLRSRGRWITAYIELPEGYSSDDINVSTIMLNGTVPVELEPVAIEYRNCNEKPALMVKFERQEVIDLILENYQFTDKFGTVSLTLTGELKDGTFQGSNNIKIIL